MKPQVLPRPLLSIACALTVAAPAFAANTCDALYNSSLKSVQTPHHVYQ